MKKRFVTVAIPALLVLTMLCGCIGKKEDPGLSGKLAELKKTAGAQEMQEEEAGPEEKSSEEENTETVEKAESPAVRSGEAVPYDGRVIFRVYGYSSFSYSGLFGEFSRNEYPYQPNTIYAFDPAKPEDGISKICDDNGNGTMYLINGNELYSQMTAEGNPDLTDLSRVYKRTLPNGNEEEICSGRICGFSPDGGHFVVYRTSYDPYMQHYFIYETGDMDIDSAHYESDRICTFLGMDDQRAFFMEATDDGKYRVIQLENNGETYLLADCDFTEADSYYGAEYPEFNGEFATEGDKFTFTVDFFEGTGHFYAMSVDVTVPICLDGASSSVLYDAVIEGYTKQGDPQIAVPQPLEGIDKYADTETGNGLANVLQYYETLEDGIFYTVAQAHRDPFEDIGWRMSYSMQNLRYYFLPSGKKDPVLLHTMFEPLGKRGTLYEYEYYEMQPTIYAYAQFLTDREDQICGVVYETIYTEGPETPLERSGIYHMAMLADDFYFENLKDDYSLDEFVVGGRDALADTIYNHLYGDF